MKRRPPPTIDWDDPLKATLAHNGFWIAAANLSWVPDREAALSAWDDYPLCMNIYPFRLDKSGGWWMAKNETRSREA